MSEIKLEERVSLLEEEMKKLKTLLDNNPNINMPGWEKIARTFENSLGFETAMKLGNEYRQNSLETEISSDEQIN